MNSKLREYNSLLQRLKYLVERNRGDSEDAESIRDLLADCRRGLNEEDYKKARESADTLGLTEDF